MTSKTKANTPVPSKSKIMRILNNAALLKDLTPNQRKLKLADMGKANVKNLIKLGGIKGAALVAATDMILRTLPEPSGKPSRGRNVARTSKSGGYKPKGSGPKTSLKPKLRPKPLAKKDQGKGGKFGDGSTAVKRSLRPQLRPKK